MSLKIRYPRVLLLLAVLTSMPVASRADTVILTTGEQVTGTIKSETDTEVTIDVPVSASITDERVFKKEEVARVEKDQPDQIAYKQLILVQPNPEVSYPSATYDQILAPLKAFESKFPTSAYLPEIQKLDATFLEEKKRVDAGQVKYMGRWLSSEEAAKPEIKSQIGAIAEYDAMKQQASADELVNAMVIFDTIEKDYPGTRVYPEAAALARGIMPKLQAELAGRMQEVKLDQDQLKKTIDFTAEPEKTSIINAAKAKKDREDAAVAAAVKAGAKWVPLIPLSETSIDSLQKTAATEAGRLAGLPIAAMTQSVAKSDAAAKAAAGGDYKTADTLLKAASALWAQNIAARDLGNSVRAELSATPTPTPKPAPPTPRPLPTVSHAAQAALAEATPAAVEEDKPFFMTVPGAISIAAVVLVVGGIIASYSQRKARKQATAE